MDSKAHFIGQQLAGKLEDNNPSGEDCQQPVTVPDHTLLKCIGRGSYGTVWLARNMMGNFRAVKVVFRSSFQNQRPFERELAGIRKFEPISRSYEGFIDVLHVGINESEGYFYYVMEPGDDMVSGQNIDPEKYVPKTLSKEISLRGKLPVEVCLQSGLALSQALWELHKHGLVHRDVKPANIIFVNGVAKLADIGLVAEAKEAQSYVGTEGFIPPEGPGTPQADIFSLGKVLYEAATGKDRQDFPELPTRVDELPDARGFLELNEVILHACKRDRSERYQSAWDMHADLVVLANGKSVKRLKQLERRVTVLKRVAGISSLVLLLVFAVSYQAYREWARVVENRERQVGANVAYGNRAMDSGDLLHALPYFAEALRLDEHGKQQNIRDRLRFGVVLAHCPKLTQLWSEGQEIDDAEFSSDGKRIVVAEYNGAARIYELPTGGTSGKTCGAGTRLRSAAFSPDGKYIVTSGEDGYARIWDANNLERIDDLPHPGPVYHSSFNFDGSRLITACGDGNARVWNFKTRKQDLIIKHGTNDVCFAAFSGDGRLIVTTGYDYTARIWDAVDGHAKAPPLRHKSWVIYAAFSPDNEKLATASWDRSARVWETGTGRQILPDMNHLDGVGSVEFSPDGRMILTASFDGTARLWHADTLAPLGSNPLLRHRQRVSRASFGHDGHTILTASIDGTVRIWDLASGALPIPVPSVSLSDDGSRYLAVTNGIFQVRETISDRPISTLVNTGHAVDKAELGCHGYFVLGMSEIRSNSASTNHLLQFWDANTGQVLASGLELTNSFSGMAFSGEGKRLAIFREGSAQIWDIVTRKPISPWLQHDERISSAIFNSDATLLATVSGSKLRLWNVQSGKLLFEPLKHLTRVKFAEFSPDGSLIITGCQDDQFTKCYAQVWSVATGLPVGPQLGHNDGVISASFSPDGRRVVTGSEDFTAMEWDFATGQKLIPDLRHEISQKRGF
ncbi:serine/threonine-protein kinase [Pedosphaera parvula]|uniref:Serine/threonine protein kinase with WD40 repeats n=1 Tax=Pedosphaera parvula (strain Ellin514) TaxID=320771 RepID=B9XAV5_PEDPL|nr:protein kinase [Pedosphaera parvula]EEF63140.1 serine/threonine protein kinase with WD40 repeats [Pedosphaera parvula Ellin514]